MSDSALLEEVRKLSAKVDALTCEIRGKTEWLTVPKLRLIYGRSRAQLKKMFKEGRLPGIECSVRGGWSFKVRREDAERVLGGAK